MKKRKIAALALIIGCLAILTSGTIAYFTAEGSANLNYQAGRIDIRIVQDDELAGTPEKPVQPDFSVIMPGAQRRQMIRVQNTSSQPAYVRIAIHKNIRLAKGVLGRPDETLIRLVFNYKSWLERGGYYYYRDPLGPGDLTEPLFTEVEFSPLMGDLYEGCAISITVAADAVQWERNGGDVLMAAGWP